VTGGAGYIGSHTVLELLILGYNVVVVDNLSNSYEEALRRVSFLAFGISEFEDPRVTFHLKFHKVDLQDYDQLEAVFQQHRQDLIGVIHFAALKAVQESCEFPELYWNNNVVGAENLLRCMKKYSIYNIIFSSSACVYGDPHQVPITEDFPLKCTFTSNPYGKTKSYVEALLKDNHAAFPDKWQVVILRYFNPIGAHPSGILGEHPRKGAANLMPILAQVSQGTRPTLSIFGNDYPTKDKTAVRDYIHVMDLAKGHVAAVNKFQHDSRGFWVYNLGTGTGYSVLEVVEKYRKVSGLEIPFVFERRRQGDVPVLVADPSAAEHDLKWKAEKSIEDMCQDFYNWQKKNPHGYTTIVQDIKVK